MASLEQLRFAQRFPFSSLAKNVLKELGMSLEEVQEETMNRAAVMISRAITGKEYFLEVKTSDLLEQEIVAFPVAKILVSLMNDSVLFRNFSLMVAKSAFLYLEKSPDKKQLALELAESLNITHEVVDCKGVFVSLPIEQFLAIEFNDKMLRLVNQRVSKGRVFLNINLFCRFLSELVFSRVMHTLPSPTGNIPEFYKSFAKQLSSSKIKREKEVSFKALGNLSPGSFPPCYVELYSNQLKGESLPHMARFFLASFLNAVGMPQKEILAAFSKSPNFDERIASYQIKRIASQNYTPASCDKMNDYGFCNSKCGVRHPLTLYRHRLKAEKKQGNEKPHK